MDCLAGERETGGPGSLGRTRTNHGAFSAGMPVCTVLCSTGGMRRARFLLCIAFVVACASEPILDAGMRDIGTDVDAGMRDVGADVDVGMGMRDVGADVDPRTPDARVAPDMATDGQPLTDKMRLERRLLADRGDRLRRGAAAWGGEV